MKRAAWTLGGVSKDLRCEGDKGLTAGRVIPKGCRKAVMRP